ncbi:MAG: aldehyde dehydrogenase [Pseudomonadota bacterium]
MRLPRWDVLVVAGALAAPVLAAGGALASNVEIFGANWPDTPVAEQVGYYCIACHSLEIIKQQGLDKETWDDVIVWMEEDMGMNPLDDETQDQFTTFLADYFGPDRKAMSGGG